MNILSTQTLPHFHEFAYKYSTVFTYKSSFPEVFFEKLARNFAKFVLIKRQTYEEYNVIKLKRESIALYAAIESYKIKLGP